MSETFYYLDEMWFGLLHLTQNKNKNKFDWFYGNAILFFINRKNNTFYAFNSQTHSCIVYATYALNKKEKSKSKSVQVCHSIVATFHRCLCFHFCFFLFSRRFTSCSFIHCTVWVLFMFFPLAVVRFLFFCCWTFSPFSAVILTR